MVTRMTAGIVQLRMSENRFTQLPTPEDCISKTARCPPPGAGNYADTFFLGRRRQRADRVVGVESLDQGRFEPPSGT